MEKKTKTDIIKDLIECQGGYVTRKDINNHDIPSAMLSQYAKKFGLVKHDTGFYSKEEWPKDDFLILQYEYPKLVYSLYSAAYLHHLISEIPHSDLEVTAPKNYRPFPLPRKGVILHTDTKDKTYNLGIQEIETEHKNKVGVYDLEKTVCDFVKNKNKIEDKIFDECISNYKKRTDKNISNLLRYASEMKITNEVHSLLESMFRTDSDSKQDKKEGKTLS